jgi:ABC transporter C-terminal domain
VVEDVLLVEDGRASLVAGGYAAWRESRLDRRVGVSVATPKATVPSANQQSNSGSASGSGPVSIADLETPKKKSKSTVGFQMRELEKEIARLDKRRATLEADLVKAGSDHVKLSALGADLAEVTTKMNAAEEQWLVLAEE